MKKRTSSDCWFSRCVSRRTAPWHTGSTERAASRPSYPGPKPGCERAGSDDPHPYARGDEPHPYETVRISTPSRLHRSVFRSRSGISTLLAIALLITPVFAACGGDDSDSSTLTVFAASSLTASFTELGEAFEAQHEDVAVEFNFAGSQALATQIVEGASADVYASANSVQMERVVEAGLNENEPAIFARNQLVVIVPADNPADVQSVNDLGNPDLNLVLAAEEVPVGRYARQTLDALIETVAFQEQYPDFNAFNIVSNETNVNQVVTRVRLGEADAGIVYETDVTPEVAEEVEMIPIPEDLNVIAEYPIIALADGNTDLAGEFINFLFSDDGRQIMAGWGFRPGDSE